MSAAVILIVLTRSGPRSRTFFHTANSSSRTPAEAGGRPPPRPSGFVYTFEGPHRPMTPPERSSQPRDQRHRALSLWHPPDGCARRAPSGVQAAMAEESPKTLESAKTVSMANGQLTRAVPGSRRTSPEEPARAVYALRKAPTRSGPSDAKPRRGKRVKAYGLRHATLTAHRHARVTTLDRGSEHTPLTRGSTRSDKT